MEKMRRMKAILECSAEEQLAHLEDADTQEMGEVIDMIKDLEEAMYYHSIRKAMDDSYYIEKEGTPHHMTSYIEAKEKHMDKALTMNALEHDLHEISEEIMDMIALASAEEKQYMSKKISGIMTKISE
jgi:hypothetical protein